MGLENLGFSFEGKRLYGPSTVKSGAKKGNSEGADGTNRGELAHWTRSSRRNLVFG